MQTPPNIDEGQEEAANGLQTAIDPVQFLIETARTNFAAFVSLVHRPRYKHSTFSGAVCRAVDTFVDDVLAGKRPVLMLTAPPQHGKQLAHSTPMLTANRGWTTHGDLRVGDLLYRPNGGTTTIVALSAEHPCDTKFKFSDGSEIITHSRHEWLLHKSWQRTRAACIFETQDVIKKGLWSGVQGARSCRANFQLSRIAPLRGIKKDLPIAPYTLGVWLGDGVRTKPLITTQASDHKMLDAIATLGNEISHTYEHKKTGVLHVEYKSLREPLRNLGLFNEGCGPNKWVAKHIPDIYFNSDIEQRLELLAGLIDSDGYIYKKNGRVTISTCEAALATSIVRLISTFGWTATTTWFEPVTSSSGIVGKQRVAQICFQHNLRIPCRLDRKNLAQRTDRMHRKRAIHAVETGAFEMGRCIQIAHEDGMYLAGNTLIPTHNSSLISRCLPPYLFGRLTGELPAVRIACASYAHTLAQRNRRDAQAIMSDPVYRAIFPKVALLGFTGVDNASDGLQVPGDGWLRGVGIGGGLTGFSVDIGIIDDAVKNSQDALSEVIQERNRDWYDSVFSTRLQQRSGQIIIGTPWSAHDLLAHISCVCANNANFTALSFPALNDSNDVGYNPNLPEGALVPHLHNEDKLKEIKKNIAKLWWAAMYQQSPLADLGAIFPRANVQHYRRADVPLQMQQIIMSVDATFKDGKTSDFVAIGVWGKTPDNRVWLLDYQRKQLGFMSTAQAISDLKAKWPKVGRIYIEEAANGAALIDMLKKHFSTIVGVPPLGSKEARAHAVSWVWSNNLVLLPHPDESPGIVPWVAEITAFPDVKNDDTVDCMTIALHQLCLRSPIAMLITKDILRDAH